MKGLKMEGRWRGRTAISRKLVSCSGFEIPHRDSPSSRDQQQRNPKQESGGHLLYTTIATAAYRRHHTRPERKRGGPKPTDVAGCYLRTTSVLVFVSLHEHHFTTSSSLELSEADYSVNWKRLAASYRRRGVLVFFCLRGFVGLLLSKYHQDTVHPSVVVDMLVRLPLIIKKLQFGNRKSGRYNSSPLEIDFVLEVIATPNSK
ncbi:hypothetical protein LXL04_026600 [Taraxacum kok-saghyz]